MEKTPSSSGGLTPDFRIVDAVRDGYIALYRHAGYLVRLLVLPFGLQLITALLLFHYHKDAPAIERFLWGLPASVVYAWFMFLQARLFLTGERLDRLPDDEQYRVLRLRAMQISVMVALLVNMGFTAIGAFMEWSIVTKKFGTSMPVSGGVMLAIGAMFWGVRLALLPTVAAVGVSMKKFVFAVDGAMFSLRLIGLGALALTPVIFIFQMLAAFFVREEAVHVAIVFTVIFSVIMTTVLNGCAIYAVRQVLPPPRIVGVVRS